VKLALSAIWETATALVGTLAKPSRFTRTIWCSLRN